MKRLAILLSHVDGELSSNKDAGDMYKFLVSLRGGAWSRDEIFYEDNIQLWKLCDLIDDVRNRKLDYLFFYFSGHGGYVRDTELELNPDEERISERHLTGLADRQLNIYDCCRAPISKTFAEDSMEMLKEATESMRSGVRNLFNSRVMAAAPQHMSLYACRIGQKAYDDGNGGVYTQKLLSTANAASDRVLLASQVHARVSEQMLKESILQGCKAQTPDYFMAKLPSRLQLPFAINPNQI